MKRQDEITIDHLERASDDFREVMRRADELMAETAKSGDDQDPRRRQSVEVLKVMQKTADALQAGLDLLHELKLEMGMNVFGIPRDQVEATMRRRKVGPVTAEGSVGSVTPFSSFLLADVTHHLMGQGHLFREAEPGLGRVETTGKDGRPYRIYVVESS